MSFWFWVLFLFIYINVGYVLAGYCWKNYKGYEKRGFVDFLLWPLSTLEEWGLWESAGGNSPIIESFKSSNDEAVYKAIVSFLWPIKVLANLFLILIYACLICLILSSRLIATLVVLSVKVATFPGKKLFGVQDLGNVDLLKIWLKPIAIKEF